MNGGRKKWEMVGKVIKFEGIPDNGGLAPTLPVSESEEVLWKPCMLSQFNEELPKIR